MVGYISDALATALSGWPELKQANIMPVRATDGANVVVNTTLPAIAVQVNGVDGEGNTYLGGGIRQYFEIVLHVILPVTNYTFSRDKGAQANTLDISDDVIRCMERTTLLDEVKQKHDLNMQFDRMETDTTYGTKGATNICVDVHRVIYKADVQFNPFKKDEPVGEVVLERVEQDVEDNKTIIP